MSFAGKNDVNEFKKLVQENLDVPVQLDDHMSISCRPWAFGSLTMHLQHLSAQLLAKDNADELQAKIKELKGYHAQNGCTQLYRELAKAPVLRDVEHLEKLQRALESVGKLPVDTKQLTCRP